MHEFLSVFVVFFVNSQESKVISQEENYTAIENLLITHYSFRESRGVNSAGMTYLPPNPQRSLRVTLWGHELD